MEEEGIAGGTMGDESNVGWLWTKYIPCSIIITLYNEYVLIIYACMRYVKIPT